MSRFKPQRENFIPKGAIKITPKDVDAVVYIYDRAGKVYALAFGGKRNRPDIHVQYANATRREQAVREYLDNMRKVKAYRDEQAAKRSGFRHSFKVGDVLHYSWGYEQTQCEFYEVISTTPGTITMREIAQVTAPGSEISHGMAESRLAVKGSFLDNAEPITKRVQYAESEPGYVTMKHGGARLWNGQPKYRSWYA